MFSVDEAEDRLSFRFSSHVHLIDRVVDDCRRFVQERDPAGGTGGLSQLLRELLLNAIEHGNKGDADKVVECELLRIGECRYRVVVNDRGAGFDPSALRLESSDEGQERSRGYAIINSMADSLEFSPDTGGVTAYVTLPVGTTFERTEGPEGWTVVPSGDITAAVAEPFRSLLLEWVDGGAPSLGLDMTKVKNVDSICLSVLVSFFKIFDPIRGERVFELYNVGSDLMNLFVMTRLVRLFPVKGEA